jgi:hypothetical protein
MPRGGLGQFLVLVAVTMVVAGSLCILDADDGTGVDLCNVVLLPVVGLVLGAPQLLVGRLAPIDIPIHLGAALDRPVPPPRA